MMAQRLESTTSIARARSTAALFNLTTSLGQIVRKNWHLKPEVLPKAIGFWLSHVYSVYSLVILHFALFGISFASPILASRNCMTQRSKWVTSQS